MALPRAHSFFLTASLSLVLTLAGSAVGAAVPVSFRSPHPLTWMHSLPVGEAPGWTGTAWFHQELSVANIWNAPLNVQNRKTGKNLSYQADFEQSSAILEAGFALNSFLALAVEIPYAHRGGGFLDQFIDDFHATMGFDRFNREKYAFNESSISVKTEDSETLGQGAISGVGNVKYKAKLWWLKWSGSAKGSCPCGFATSAQVKVPVAARDKGLTSGDTDYSLLWHLGIPLFQESSLWLSSAVTHLGDNESFKDWPRLKWQQMYEVGLDLALTENWGLIFQHRSESPFMESRDLDLVETGGSARERYLARIASGWNGLVYWRGAQSFGFRYRPSEKRSVNFLLTEDWNLGHFDGRSEHTYVNNAPDVSFIIQNHFSF